MYMISEKKVSLNVWTRDVFVNEAFNGIIWGFTFQFVINFPASILETGGKWKYISKTVIDAINDNLGI